MSRSFSNLVCEPEPFNFFQHLPASSLSPICNIKVCRKSRNKPNNENMTANTDPNSRQIPRCFLLPHNETSGNPSCTIEHRNNGSGESSLPLSGDVICVVRCQSRPVRDICSSGKVGPNIADRDLVREAKHAKSDDETDAVEDYDGSTES